MSFQTNNLTAGFIDLATHDHLETRIYGGDSAVTYFVRQHKKSTWFTQVPVVLTNAAGSGDFGQHWSVTISRAGDYLLQTWLEVVLPVYTNAAGWLNFWCKNLMHNLVEECTISFNDLVAARFTSEILDFWTAFTVPSDKKVAYDEMIGAGEKIGSKSGLTNHFVRGLSVEGDGAGRAHRLSLPLPFFFSRDTGVSLPTAALPYNDMRINFKLRPQSELLSSFTTAALAEKQAVFSVANIDESALSPLTSARVWANYAIVSNQERKLMGKHARNIVIEQFQHAPITTFDTSSTKTYDIRFSHGIKALMFGLRSKDINTDIVTDNDLLATGTGGDVFSRYHDRSDAAEAGGSFERTSPIDNVTLLYENTTRLGTIPSQFFTHLQPYYHAPAVHSSEPGLHLYSYALDMGDVDACGSTNFGKLTNVSIAPAAVSGLAGNWDLVVNAVNHNVVRISGGALGFPVL